MTCHSNPPPAPHTHLPRGQEESDLGTTAVSGAVPSCSPMMLPSTSAPLPPPPSPRSLPERQTVQTRSKGHYIALVVLSLHVCFRYNEQLTHPKKREKKGHEPGDRSGVWGTACLQPHISGICISLLQGTFQVAPPLEVSFQQGLATHPHPTHGAVIWAAAWRACTHAPHLCLLDKSASHPTHGAMTWTAA